MDDIIGSISYFGFSFAQQNWAHCDGQLLSISSNTALFALLGTTYGGNGTTTFALPDLRSCTIVGAGQGDGLSEIYIGEKSGIEASTLLQFNLPMHTHDVSTITVQTIVATTPGGGINETDNGAYGFGSGGSFPNIFSESTPVTSNPVGGVSTILNGNLDVSGGNQKIDLRNPFLGITTNICLYGIFPSRN